MSPTGQPLWGHKALEELSCEEWEALCDGCGRCCLHKLEDEQTGEIVFTRVVCRLLDQESCCCTDYANRCVQVSTCLSLTPQLARELAWLPSTCAYRLVAAGEPLPEWHPLVSGHRETVHEAGISVRGKVLSEQWVHPDGLDEHIIHWVD